MRLFSLLVTALHSLIHTKVSIETDISVTIKRPAFQEPKPIDAVTIAAVLDDLAHSNPEKLDWRHSVVDLMKLVGLDSSRYARSQLAAELGFDGTFSGKDNENIWLHQQVIEQLRTRGIDLPQ